MKSFLNLSMGVVLIFQCGALRADPSAPPVASLDPARSLACTPSFADCSGFDAVVFVHGIYGNDDTFVNPTTSFDWPSRFPSMVSERRIDVYRLNYQSAMLSWAKKKNPRFDEVAKAVKDALKPLRDRRYRTIGFIAHSLGGNVVSTYIHLIKTGLGHPQRSQNAFVITLATPVLGAQVADLGTRLKQGLGIEDDLLDSLKSDNLYLRMLLEFREEEDPKEKRYVCRPVHLHAAYEEEYLGPILVVSEDSAAVSVSRMVKSPVVGFRLDHSEIAKPDGPDHVVYRWVLDRVEDEYLRVATWEDAHKDFPPERRLCERMEFIPE